MKNIKSSFICIYDFMISGLGLSLFECVVYAIIFSYSRDGVGEFFASIAYIAKRTGYSTRNVQRALASLLKKNLITRTQAVCYGKKFNTYSINEETLAALCPNEIQREEDPRMMSQEEYSKKLRAAAREHFSCDGNANERDACSDNDIIREDNYDDNTSACASEVSEGVSEKEAAQAVICLGDASHECHRFSSKAAELLAYTKFTGKKKYIAFGRHQGVLLTQPQYRALLRKHGLEMLMRYINQLEEWILNCHGFENNITNHYQILRQKFG